MADMSFVDAHVYTIDIFLCVMARHGYTLQRSRKRLTFRDIDDTIARDKREFAEVLKRALGERA